MTQKEAVEIKDNREVDDLIQKIIDSGLMKAGDRAHSLLQYLLTEELAGRGDRLKAYSIAIDVFKRGEDFNPAIDSTVRVEMLRLRRAIKAYALAAPEASLIVEFAKGSYRPKFYRTPATRPTRRTRSWIYAIMGLGTALCAFALVMSLLPPKRDYCSVPTLAIKLSDSDPSEQTVLMAEAISMVKAYQTVQVIGNKAPCENNIAYQLSLQIDRQDPVRIVANLTAGPNETRIWADAKELPKQTSTEDILTLLAQYAFELASEDGILMVEALKADWPSPTNKRNLECLRLARAFLSFHEKKPEENPTSCLERAIKNSEHDSRIYSAYALVIRWPYIRDRQTPPPEIEAQYQQLVARALDLDPLDTRAITARLVELRRVKPPRLDELLRLANLVNRYLSRYPEMLRHASMVEGYYLGNWEQAGAMIDRAISISGPNPDYQYVAVASEMMTGEWEKARDRLNVRQEAVNALEGILMLAVGQKLNDEFLIRQGQSIISKMGLENLEQIKEYIGSHNYEPAISNTLYTLSADYYASLQK